MIARYDGAQGELAVVHALGENGVIVTVRRLGADPGHVVAIVGIQLAREEDGLAIVEFVAFLQGLD